ncbi:MAG: protein kinase domain-containing protein [Elainella sp.]
MSYSPGTESKRSKYRLLGLIGQGQFGQVFCAVHRPTGRLVALKNLEHDRFPTHKFLRELRFLLSLQHPNIVTCQALEHTATGRYLVMDYCEGGTLRNLMPEEYRLSLFCVLNLVIDVLAGLEHAHSRGIVHCDIKPENILIQFTRDSWIARISDFGIARLNQEIWLQEGALGSPAYMAPERFYGQYSEASDLYAVGILLFELLAGYRPFSGTPVELRSAHLNQPLALTSEIPESCRAILTTALQKLPGRRFRSAAAMRAALEAVQQPGQQNVQSLRPAPLNLFSSAASGSGASPLFVTVTPPYRCVFRPTQQKTLAQPIQRLAVATLDPESIAVYQAGRDWFSCQVIPPEGLLSPKGQGWNQQKAGLSGQQFSDPVEQLLLHPSGCLVMTQRSIAHLQLDFPNSADAKLQSLASWTEPQLVTVDPQANWFATFGSVNSAPAESTTESNLELQPVGLLRLAKLPCLLGNRSAQPWVGADMALGLEGVVEFASLLALDSRHLALVTTTANGSLTQIVTRRGRRVGSLSLPMRLRAIAATGRSGQFLALDSELGTVLLIDLKPYRIKRWWVEITPDFLLTIDWGYVLAAAGGQIVFLDETGRGVGALELPQPITAIAPLQQQGLLVATWQAEAGQLFSINLQELGLDLVF